MKIYKYLILPAVLLMFTFVSVAFMNVASVNETQLVEDGEEIYTTRCVACHMATGEGVAGVFPPLTESEYVTGDKGRLIRMILNGLSGEITVNDVTYSGMMPPWGSFLNDEQVSQVLTYVRSNLGNDADAVSEEEVARVRAKVADRKDTWTIEELNEEANRGIPEGD